jgi:hypothetical protein
MICPMGRLNSHCQHQQFLKVGCTETSHRIPTNGRVEALRATSRVIAQRDIIQSSVPYPVQPRVQEAQRRLSSINPSIVEHRNERRKGGRRAGCAGFVAYFTLVDDEEVQGLRSDVGDTTAMGVVQTFIGSGSECLQVPAYCRMLVMRSRELNTELISAAVEAVMKMNTRNC